MQLWEGRKVCGKVVLVTFIKLPTPSCAGTGEDSSRVKQGCGAEVGQGNRVLEAMTATTERENGKHPSSKTD